ncbi:glycosyltransferase family 9 protein [Nakamurella deserti]|uniref:glycosyltransferase family 9 protein n=1 Tax=Nakamurella deserti TaxID=2164074 RepID=UPI000DBE53D0|nr:glycosyltransferase family 9 protein [Nakamurella deserti]
MTGPSGAARRAVAPDGPELAGSGVVGPLAPLADPSVRSVVLVRLRTGLGDLLASVPALRSLRTARPDLHVALMSYPEMAGIVARQAAYVDEFLPFPGDPGVPERPAPERAVIEAFTAGVRDRGFDVAVQMYGALPAANRVTAGLGARITAGFVTPGAWPADLTTHLPYPVFAHEIDRHLRLMEFLGAPAGSRDLEFPLTADDLAVAGRELDAAGLAGRPFAVVHPGATAASRQWPAERFATVADGLVERGLGVAVTGVPGERELVDRVLSGMREPAADLCGRTSLGGAAAVIARAAVVVSGDTGVVQLAVASRTPTVTAYLAGDARRWRGADRRRHRVVAVDVGCNPCGLQTCPIDFRCARLLTADRMLAEVDDVLHPADALGTPGV